MTSLDENLEFIAAAEQIDNLVKDEKWEEISQRIESLPEWMRNSPDYQAVYQKANCWLSFIEKTNELNSIKDPQEYETLLRLINQQETCKSKDQLLQAFTIQARNNIIPVMGDWDSIPGWYDGCGLQQLLGAEVKKAQDAKRLEKLCQKANDLMQSSPDQWLDQANKVLGEFDDTGLELDETGREVKEKLRRMYDFKSRLSTLEQSLAQVDESLRQIQIGQEDIKKSLDSKTESFWYKNKYVLFGGGGAIILAILLIAGYFIYPLIQRIIAPNSPLATQTQPAAVTFIDTSTPSVSGPNPTQTIIVQETQIPNTDTPTPQLTDPPSPTMIPVPTPQLFQVLAEDPLNGKEEVEIFSDTAASDAAYILFPNNLDSNNQDGKVKIVVAYVTGEDNNARRPITLIVLIDSKFVVGDISQGLVTLQYVDGEAPRLRSPNPSGTKNPVHWGYVGIKGVDIPVKGWLPESAENIPENFIWIEIIGWIDVARLTPLAGQ